MSEWKWYMAHIVGMGDCAFEANTEKVDSGDQAIPIKNLVHIQYKQNMASFAIWGPFMFKMAVQFGTIHRGTIAVMAEATPEVVEQIEKVLSRERTVQNGTGQIVAASGEQLRRLPPTS